VHSDAPEQCNAVDDDCDGSTDEVFECVRSVTYTCVTACDTLGSFSCSENCEMPLLPEQCDPPEEVCNALDDDCDGDADETFACASGEVTECEGAGGEPGLGICSDDCELPSRLQCQLP
jgi:hypothetical protein